MNLSANSNREKQHSRQGKIQNNNIIQHNK